jgi:MerR family transcriptional regulator, thiopeptide resistance regulator
MIPGVHDLPAVVPLLVYRDIEGAHAFLVEAFGFKPGLIERTEGGDVVHGEVHVDGQVIWLHRVMTEDDWVSPESSPLTTGELVVRVDDVDAHCERARATGAEIEYGPQDQDYGVREYGARDLERRRWCFVTPLG